MRPRLHVLALLAPFPVLAAGAEEPAAPAPPPAEAAPAPAEPPAPEAPAPALTLDLTASPQPKDDKHQVQIQGATTLPDKAIVQCHFYVTFATLDGQERANFIDGRSGVVKEGKLEVTMGPYAMVPGTYRVEAVVDPHRQYPEVQKVLADRPEIRVRADFAFGSAEEIAAERELGRPRILRSSEQIVSLVQELLNHARDLQGPLEKGEWEAAWVLNVHRIRDRHTLVPGRVVGQNQVSRPIAERYDDTERALHDLSRALLKAYETLGGALPKPEEGDPPAWDKPVTHADLQAMAGAVFDHLGLNYRQDLVMRLEGVLSNCKLTYQAVLDQDADPELVKQFRVPARDLWSQHHPKWLEECRRLREELALLSDPNAPRPFVKQMARRLSPVKESVDALAQDAETVLRGYAQALAAKKPPAPEVGEAVDRFYAGYARYLLVVMGGGE